MDIINFIVNDLPTVIAYLIAIASIIVKLTPTLSDDNSMKEIIKFIGKYIALNKTISPTEQKEANKESKE